MSEQHKKYIEDIVRSLLQRGKEGDYWDFKQEWHENISDLIKDIICFANTVHDKDCYLIFGVSNKLEVVGMQKQRRKQADIIDTISNLHFAGDNYPKIELETISYEGTELDILIIFNTNKTPIYLKCQYEKMHLGCIYSRIGDKNTPNNGNSDVGDIENLWKKRFGLMKTILDYIYDHICHISEWTIYNAGSNHEGYKFEIYNNYKPDYKIEAIFEYDLARSTILSYIFDNETVAGGEFLIKYNNVILESLPIVSIGKCELKLLDPHMGLIFRERPKDNWGYIYGGGDYAYFLYDSKEYKIIQLLNYYKTNDYDETFNAIKKAIVFYHNEIEKNDFENFAKQKKEIIITLIKNNNSYSHIEVVDYNTKFIKFCLTLGVVLNGLLDEWRAERETSPVIDESIV